jgi:N-acetylglucosamine-6-phosphate deacetylase
LVTSELLDLKQACSLFSENPARVYGLERKGRLYVGADADVLVLDAELQVKDVVVRGQRAVTDGRVVLRGTFSPNTEGDR